MILKHRSTCRVCGSKSLRPMVRLGAQNLQGSFIKEGVSNPPIRKIPCVLTRCNPEEDENACGLLQLAHSVPPELLYSDYWYKSGTNQTMRGHLEDIAESAMNTTKLRHGAVLDIGCNDCTLLKSFPETWRRVGVDPYRQDGPPGGIEIIKEMFPSINVTGSYDVITSIAMFYDLEDPVGFARAVCSILNDKGVWILEMSYMPRMISNLSYDTICFEHLEYYSLSVIERILKSSGLKVARIELNSSNGGSLRCYVVHAYCKEYDINDWRLRIHETRVSEFDMQLDTDKPYEDFQRKIEEHGIELYGILKSLKAEGKKIHVYGASTKGNTILQWCKIDNSLIDCAADRNPDKHGAFTLGSNIPIVSEETSRSMKPDYYLVLAWHFREEFIEREQEFLQRGGKFIFPLPRIEIVSA